ncbi:MAG: endonuclease/exonuclease/phosphatase family protein [Verrucomicrobia bacterium]|nr:endonuclease/exonuclease/phosphatase family protein [Verrucomicrobiota bacterium]
MTQLKILTFNIAHGRGRSVYQGFSSRKQLLLNLSGIAQLILDSGADIVALQEVDRDSSWNKRLNLLDLIANETPLAHSVLGVNTLRSGRFQLEYGNALLTRFRVSHWENHRFGVRMVGEKGFLYCEVLLDDGWQLPIINLHLTQVPAAVACNRWTN